MVLVFVLSVVLMLVIRGCLHKRKKPLRARRTSFEADFARWLVIDDDDCEVESLVAEWDRESSFGVDVGDVGGCVGESGNSVGCAGVFFGCLGGGIIRDGRCCFSCRIVFVGMF